MVDWALKIKYLSAIRLPVAELFIYFFSETMEAKSVELCTKIPHMEPYTSITVLVTLT